MISEKLLKILACPACKDDLEYDGENNNLICDKCRLRFRIDNDIPVMLINEAEKF